MQMRSMLGSQIGASTFLVSALAVSSAAQASGPQSGWIIGGEQTMTCGWPSTTYTGGCTGSLIHKKVLATAKHCIDSSGPNITVVFGDTQDGAFSVDATCETAKDGKDWAYCILDEEVTGIPVVPPIFGCEVELLKEMIGEEVVVAGFGAENWPGGSGGFHKKQLTLELQEVASEIQVSGDASEGLCHGDSGGPVFVRLKNQDGSDGGWRMAGQTHGPGSDNAECAGNTSYSAVWDAVKAIEANEGIDVTPCTNAAGDWEPGPECKDFPANPGEAGGSWGSGPSDPSCAGYQTVTPSTCGANPNDGDDDDDDSSTGDDDDDSSTASDDDDDDSSSTSSDDDDDDSSTSSDDDDDDSSSSSSDDDDDDSSTTASDDDDDSNSASGDDDDDDSGSDDSSSEDDSDDDDDDDGGANDGGGGCSLSSGRGLGSWLIAGVLALGFGARRRRHR
jgi:hypothetical protein